MNDLFFIKQGKNSSSRAKIIDLLSDEWPLTTKQIHTRIEKNYTSNITYQAIHKIVNEMQRDGIIEKTVEGYKISVDWLQRSKSRINFIERKYLQSKKIVLSKRFSGGLEIEFNSMTDLSVSTAELLLSRQLVSDKSEGGFICTLEYGWWTLNFRFEHLLLLARMIQSNPSSRNIIRKKTPFGRWIREQYSKIGGVSAPIGTMVDVDEDLFVQGDYIIEVKFDDRTKKIFDEFYNKWNNIEDAFRDLALSGEPKIHAIMRITKSKELSSYFRKKLEGYFKRG